MSIATFSSTDAARNLRRNPTGLWPDGRRRGQRLEGIAEIRPAPSFEFSKDDLIMTMGSCFAREIEIALSNLGFVLPAMDLEIAADERGSAVANDILNKYTVQSMSNEIEWAFNPPEIAPTDLFVTAGEGLWHDPQLVANVKPASLERVMERRADVARIIRRLPECRIIVITLGLAEAWFDTKLGIYLNSMPPQEALTAEPDRFVVKVLDYQEIRDGIDHFVALCRQHGHPDQRIIMTVSPVPFKATFSGKDALAANTYSKAVQRAAVEAAVTQYDHVDYFPSFETVTLTERKLAFEIDNIHVNRPVVAEIMRRVVAAYMPSMKVDAPAGKVGASKGRDPFNPVVLLGNAFDAMERGEAALAATLFAGVIHQHHRTLKPADRNNAYSGLVRALLAGGRLDEAMAAAKRWNAADPKNAATSDMLARVLGRMGKTKKALTMAERATTLDPDNAMLWLRVARLNADLGDVEARRSAAQRALALQPGMEEAEKLAAA